jgi:hypothetical protein
MAGIERVRFCLFKGFLPEKRQSYCTKSGLQAQPALNPGLKLRLPLPVPESPPQLRL